VSGFYLRDKSVLSFCDDRKKRLCLLQTRKSRVQIPPGPLFYTSFLILFIMKFQKEYYYSLVGAVAILVVYIISALTNNVRLHLLISLFSILLGGCMVILGFWGADFAFALALRQLDQSKCKGEFKGQKKKVYVPFMGNYTPLEWWNLNWFVALIGVFLIALGSVLLGIVAGVYIF
jgi:hypothetical protein